MNTTWFRQSFIMDQGQTSIELDIDIMSTEFAKPLSIRDNLV